MDTVFDKSRGRVVAFSVNYRARFDDQWNEVIRYDSRCECEASASREAASERNTHHGRLHVHRFWRQEGRQITYLEPQANQVRDYTKALAEAQTDIKRYWPDYREHIRRRLR